MYEICDIQTNKIFVIHEYFFNQILCYDFFNDAVKKSAAICPKTKNKQNFVKNIRGLRIFSWF